MYEAVGMEKCTTGEGKVWIGQAEAVRGEIIHDVRRPETSDG